MAMLARALLLTGCSVLLLAPAPPAAPVSEPRAVDTVPGPGAGEPDVLTEPIANGVLSWDDPAVAILGTGRGICSAVLVGCRTALTAAHCICPDLEADGCLDDPELMDPERFALFFQHAGFFSVARVSVPPEFVFEVSHDVALLELDAPVTGIRPVEIGTLPGSGAGFQVAFAGFGRGDGAADGRGLKRSGRGTTVDCTDFDLPEATHVCTLHFAPDAEPGLDSGTCTGDSGGPLFTGSRSEPLLIGVASGAGHLGCRAPLLSYFTELASAQSWLQEAGGSDFGAAGCSDLPVVGGAGASVLRGDGTTEAESAARRFTFEVPVGTRELRVGVNGEVGSGNVDLYLRAGAAPTPSVFDCAGRRDTPFELCRVTAPEPGTWHVLVAREAGAPRFQVTATLLADPIPPPPAGAWLTTPEIPGFRVKARITPEGGEPLEALPVEDCIPETLCVAGALPGRPEVFLKVIGPRPNEFLWTQVSRFTPSRVELWVERVDTGALRYYRLDAVGPAASGVPGLQDRQAFPALSAD